MIASIIQISGLAAITIGAFLIAPPVGIIVGGAATIIIGLALERD